MKVLSSEVIGVDMQFAFEWLQRPYHDQRPIGAATVSQYKADMAAGRWNVGEGQIVIGTIAGGSEAGVLLAGRHRLTAVFELETVTVDMRVSFYEFSTETEMQSFYAMGTNKGKSMSLAASLQVLGTAGAIGVTNSDIAHYSAGILFIAGQFSGRNNSATFLHLKNPEAIDAILREWAGPVEGYSQAINHLAKKERYKYLRSPVVALGLLTYRYQPEKALGFWDRACSNDGLRKGEPQHALHNYLITTDLRGSHEYSSMINVIAYCWNRYMKHEPVNRMQSVNARGEKGLIVTGTPWTGREYPNLSVIFGIKGEGKGIK